MTRALMCALLLAWVFTVWPQLDLWASGLFHAPDGGFVGDKYYYVYLLDER